MVQQAQAASSMTSTSGRPVQPGSQGTKDSATANARGTSDNEMDLLEATVASLDVPAIHNSLAELKALTQSLGPAPVGPTDKPSVQALLATDDAISAAIERFGAEWLCTVEQHWPHHRVMRHLEAVKIWSSHIQALETAKKNRSLELLLVP